MLLLGLWRNWHNFDLVGGLYENTAQRAKRQELSYHAVHIPICK